MKEERELNSKKKKPISSRDESNLWINSSFFNTLLNNNYSESKDFDLKLNEMGSKALDKYIWSDDNIKKSNTLNFIFDQKEVENKYILSDDSSPEDGSLRYIPNQTKEKEELSNWENSTNDYLNDYLNATIHRLPFEELFPLNGTEHALFNETEIIVDRNHTINYFQGLNNFWDITIKKEIPINDELQEICSTLTNRVYFFKPDKQESVDLSQIKNDCLNDYIAYCENLIEPDNKKQAVKLQFARGILNDLPETEIGSALGCLYKQNREAIINFFGERIENAKTLEELALTNEQNKLLKTIALAELDIFLKSNPSKLDDSSKTLEAVLKKFNPSVYESEIGDKDEYTIEVTRDPSLIKEAALATESSCIRNRDMSYFNTVASDTGTIFLVGRKNGELQGYSRLFLMENEDNEVVLAIDTIEPPAKNFEESRGLINAFAYASVSLGLEMGARYVVMEDSRVKCGPRQAFSNTNKEMKLTKLGKHGVTSYKFNAEYQGKPYVLIENWKKCSNAN